MEEFLKKLAEYLGFTTPFIYAVVTYKFFDWLDKDVSDDAKVALAGTMRLSQLKEFARLRNDEVASSLVEVFDRVYTSPLKSKRAFLRSALFTILMTAVVLFELRGDLARELRTENPSDRDFLLFTMAFSTVANVSADYISLFIIRPWLVRSGSKPAFALITGTLIGIVFMLGVTIARVFLDFVLALRVVRAQVPMPGGGWADSLAFFLLYPFVFSVPGLAVFAWLPLFGLGMLVVRTLTPLSWAVNRLQWALRDGKEHPLKAVGIVAATFVLLLTAGWQIISKT
jgi:hypothetical protein